MSQADILKLLEEKIKQTNEVISRLDCKEEQLELLFHEALEKDHIALLIGVSVDAAAHALHRLIQQDKIKVLVHERDRRKRRYMYNDS